METFTSERGRLVDIHEYDQQCGGVLTIWLFPVFPYYGEKDQMLTVEYGPDGSFLTAEAWPGAENPEEFVASHKQRVKREEECSLPLLEAIQLDAQTQDERAADCIIGFGPSTRWYWECLAAHQGLTEARYSLGKYYKWGWGPVSKDPIRAYLWLSLAGDLESAVRFRDQLAPVMTTAQRAEAERLVAEWKPNPAECETIVAEAEN